MAGASASSHARDFLNLADPDNAAQDLLNSALRSAVRDRASRRTIRSLEQWTIEQLQLLEVKPEQALSDDKVLDVLAAIRIVTAKLPVEARGRSTTRFGHRVAALLDGLEPDFVPELLKETRRRITDNPGFAAEIADARGAMKQLHRSAEALRRDVAGTIPDEIVDEADLPIVLRSAADDQQEQTIGILVVVLLVGAIAVWYFAERNKDE